MHKGVHYFDTGYDHGRAGISAHFPLRATAAPVAKRHRGRADHRRVEPVLPVPPAGRRPHRCATCRTARLLVLVRDPVERAYSAHTHETARRYETESFERALELEPERIAGEEERLIADPAYQSFEHQHHSYLARGRYAEQLERLAVAVGRERIHVVDSGRFFAEPEPVYDEIIEFFGLPRMAPAGVRASTTPVRAWTWRRRCAAKLDGSFPALRREAHRLARPASQLAEVT